MPFNKPHGSRPGADRVQPEYIRAPFDEEVHRSAPGRRLAGSRRRPFDTRFYLILFFGGGGRIVSICSEIVLLKDLSKRVHLLNKKYI